MRCSQDSSCILVLLSGVGCEVRSAEHVAYLNVIIRKEFLSPSPLCDEVLRMRLPRVDGLERIELGNHEKLAVLCRKSFIETNPGIVLTSATIFWFNTFSFSRSACGFTRVRKTTMTIAVLLCSSGLALIKTRGCFTPLEVPHRPHVPLQRRGRRRRHVGWKRGLGDREKPSYVR